MTEAFSSVVGFNSDSFVVRIGGHATREQSPGFVSSVSEMIETCRSYDLVVDVELCDYLDSTFLGCLVVLFRRSRQRMSICATEMRREHLFSSARIDRLIPVVEPGEFRSPGDWHRIDPAEPCDATTLVQNVAAAHRCLADIDGPNAEIYRDVADQLESELRNGTRGEPPE